MGKHSFKYKEFLSFEAYTDTPFTNLTGMATAFVRPDEELLRPVYGMDSMPKKVKDSETGIDLTGGVKYWGKERVIDRRQYAKVYIEFVDLVVSEGLSMAGIKMLFFVLKMLKPGKDVVRFNIKVARCMTGYKSDKSVYEGLVDLIRIGVLARKEGVVRIFFVNAQLIFRGNRDKLIKNLANLFGKLTVLVSLRKYKSICPCDKQHTKPISKPIKRLKVSLQRLREV